MNDLFSGMTTALPIDGVLTYIAWAIVHSLWIGALVAAVVAVLRRGLHSAAPETRYAIGVAGLVAMLIGPLVAAALIQLPLDSLNETAGLPMLVDRGAVVTPAESPIASWITLIWLAGVMVLQLRLLGCWVLTKRWCTRGVTAAPKLWQDEFNDIARRMGVTSRVRLLTSLRARVPMQIGWWRPVVLVPMASWTGLAPDELRAIIAHELAHVRRHDALVNFLQAIVLTVLFHHPAAWWLSRCVRDEREFCCDDLAANACGDGTALARGLARLALGLAPPVVVLASTGGSIVTRIERLTGAHSARKRRGILASGWALPALTLTVAAVAAPLLNRAEACPPCAEAPTIERITLTPPLQRVEERLALVHEQVRRVAERNAGGGDAKMEARLRAVYEELTQLRESMNGARSWYVPSAEPAPPSQGTWRSAPPAPTAPLSHGAYRFTPPAPTAPPSAGTWRVGPPPPNAPAARLYRSAEIPSPTGQGRVDQAQVGAQTYRMWAASEGEASNRAEALDAQHSYESARRLLDVERRVAAEHRAGTRQMNDAERRLVEVHRADTQRLLEADRRIAAEHRANKSRALYRHEAYRSKRAEAQADESRIAYEAARQKRPAARISQADMIRRQIAELTALLRELEAAEQSSRNPKTPSAPLAPSAPTSTSSAAEPAAPIDATLPEAIAQSSSR